MKTTLRGFAPTENRRSGLLYHRYPLLAVAREAIIQDAEEAVRLISMLRLIVEHEEIGLSFDGTYGGQAFAQIRDSLTKHLMLVLFRMFHRLRMVGDMIDEANSYMSLMFACEYICRDSVLNCKGREQFRWGASSSRSPLDGRPLDNMNVRISESLSADNVNLLNRLGT